LHKVRVVFGTFERLFPGVIVLQLVQFAGAIPPLLVRDCLDHESDLVKDRQRQWKEEG
jgi:hypothetical protein